MFATFSKPSRNQQEANAGTCGFIKERYSLGDLGVRGTHSSTRLAWVWGGFAEVSWFWRSHNPIENVAQKPYLSSALQSLNCD